MKKIVGIIFLIALLLGCGGRMARPDEISPGPRPDYEKVILSFLKESLFDPDSLKDFSFVGPCQEEVVKTGMSKYDLVKGMKVYECRVLYNAKNRYGGYTGKKGHIIWIRNEKVVAAW